MLIVRAWQTISGVRRSVRQELRIEGLLEREGGRARQRVGRKPGLEQGLMAAVLIALLEALAGVVRAGSGYLRTRPEAGAGAPRSTTTSCASGGAAGTDV